MLKQARKFLFVLVFLIGGVGCEVLLWKTNANPTLVLILSPVLYTANLLEKKYSFLASTPLLDELIFVLPINLLYFGIVGYWLKRLSEERGFLKVILIFSVLLLIVFLHWQAALGLREVFPFLEGLNLPESPFS